MRIKKLYTIASRHASVMFIGVAIFFIQGPPFVFRLWDRLLGGGDAFINSWILAWDAYALSRPGLSVWDAPIFYPVKNALTFSEPLFGNLWLTLPVYYLTGNATFAANMLLMASFVLCMYTAFLLIYDLTGCYWSGVAAGIIFSFNPYRWSHAAHLQLLPFFWAPLALLFAHRFLKEPKQFYFYGMLVCVWIQYYASIYLGTMLLTLMIIFFIVQMITSPDPTSRWVFFTNGRLQKMIIPGALASMLVLLPLGYPYLETVRKWKFVRGLSENSFYSAEPLSYFFRPSAFFASYHGLRQVLEGQIRGGEGAVFVGVVLLLMAIISVVMVRFTPQAFSVGQKIIIRRYGWMALVVAVLTLGPFLIFLDYRTDVPLLYQLVYYLIPGAKAMRVPARFVIPLLLCLSVLAGFAISGLMNLSRRWPLLWRLLGAAIFIIILSFDYRIVQSEGAKAEPTKDFPPVYTYLAEGSRQRSILELPMGTPGQGTISFKYLHYQTSHWRPILGGNSGWFPPSVDALYEMTHSCPNGDCFEILSICPAETLVVHLNYLNGPDKTLWKTADLTPYGFGSKRQIGEALVWERKTASIQMSEKLVVIWSQWRLKKDKLRPMILVQPATNGKAWRDIGHPWLDITVVVTDTDQIQHSYKALLKAPPYLLAGRRALIKVQPIKLDTSRIKSVQFQGTALLDQTGTVQVEIPKIIRTMNGGMVAVDTQRFRRLVVDRNFSESRDIFRLLELDDGLVALKASDGFYVTAEDGGGRELVANREAIGEWETFALVKLDDGKIALRSAAGYYVRAGKDELFADSTTIGDNETLEMINP
jgi:hypothetical protein